MSIRCSFELSQCTVSSLFSLDLVSTSKEKQLYKHLLSIFAVHAVCPRESLFHQNLPSLSTVVHKLEILTAVLISQVSGLQLLLITG